MSGPASATPTRDQSQPGDVQGQPRAAAQRQPPLQRHAEPAEDQLPGARRQHVEAERRVVRQRRQRQRERAGADQRQDRPKPAPGRRPAPERQQQQRVEQVELPLHRQRPGVQEPVGARVLGEVAAVVGEGEVRDEQLGVGQVAGQPLEGPRIEQRRTEQPEPGAQHVQRRNDPPRARQVEAAQAEPAAFQPPHDDPRHQVAGDGEEDVDARKAAADMAAPQVERHDQRDGERAQAIDVAAESFPSGGRRRDVGPADGGRRRHAP